MMRIFSRTVLQWNEPKALQIASYKEGKRSLGRIVPIVICLSLLLVGVTCTFAVEAAGRMIVALGGVILFIYAILWVYRVFPSYVRITERGISQSVTNDDETIWKFGAVEHCKIATTHVNGRTLRVLVIETKQGERSTIGIADSVSTETLRETLMGKGVKVLTMAESVNDGL